MLALAVRGKVDDPQVYAKRSTVWFVLRRSFATLGDVQVVDASTPYQIGAAYFPVGIIQHGALTIAKHQSADDATLQRVERHPLQDLQPIGPRIVAHTATRPKLRADLTMLRFDRLDGFNGFHPSAHSQLRAQTKHRAGFTIRAMVGGRLVGDALTPTHPSDPGCCLVEGALCHGQHLSVAVNVQLAADRAG